MTQKYTVISGTLLSILWRRPTANWGVVVIPRVWLPLSDQSLIASDGGPEPRRRAQRVTHVMHTGGHDDQSFLQHSPNQT
jgi:hypothetical protein